MEDPTKRRGNKVPAVPRVLVPQGQFCPGQGQEEGLKEVAGALNEERWHVREGRAGDLEALGVVDI